MKPIHPTSRPARHNDGSRPFGHYQKHAPITDWSFQASNPDLRGGGSASFPEPAFHTLSDEFFAEEARKEWRLEAGAFVAIAVLSLWPLVSAAQAVLALLK